VFAGEGVSQDEPPGTTRGADDDKLHFLQELIDAKARMLVVRCASEFLSHGKKRT
jgi:hypothetical protein